VGLGVSETGRFLSIGRVERNTAHGIGYATPDEGRQGVIKRQNLIG